MKTIYYKLANSKTLQLEVTDEFATNYMEIEIQSRREEERYKWRARKHLTSLNRILDAGGQLEEYCSDFSEMDYRYEDLHNAIKKLTPEQQDLIDKVFFQGKKLIEIAKEDGVDKSAITKRMQRIYAQLKKYLTTPSTFGLWNSL